MKLYSSVLAAVVGASAGNTATRTFLPTTNGAVCLDGSPAAVYFKQGAERTKFVILQRGGGWCTSDEGCAERTKTSLGSSSTYPKTQDLNTGAGDGAMYDAPWAQLSDDPALNPMMSSWSFVFLPYCDGGSQVGDRKEAVVVGNATIYYRGARILAAVQKHLLENAGLAAATDVVLVGGSAGALSTYLHADTWSSALPTAKVVAMPDSGFFLDYNVSHGATQSYHDLLVWVYTAMNGSAAMPATCVAAHASDPSACIFAEHVAPTLKTPTFALQSTYDAYQVSAELHATPANVSAINAYGAVLAVTLTSTLLASLPLHGAFLDSCFHHTREWGNITIDGDVAATAFTTWYAALGRPGAKQSWVQGATYPCKACCENGQR